MPENLKQQMEKVTEPKIHFKLQSRFWHNATAAEAFYRELAESVVVYHDKLGTVSKLKSVAALFSLSPDLLLQQVQEECQAVLLRRSFVLGEPIDFACLKKLHHNMVKYLACLPISEAKVSLEILKQAKEPMLYYHSFINDQGLAELIPVLVIPTWMSQEVRAYRGGLLKTNLLCLLPAHMNSTECLQQLEGRPTLHKMLSYYLEHNPKAKQEIDQVALTAKTELDIVAHPARMGSVTFYSDVQARSIAALVGGKITVHGKLTSEEDLLLASLFDNVEICSRVERRHLSPAHFQEVLLRAELKAKQIIIAAVQNALFSGDKITAEHHLHVVALANILSVPVPLVTQEISHYYSKRHQRTTVNTTLIQQSSEHQASSSQFIAEENIHLQSLGMKSEAWSLSSQTGQVVIEGTENLAIHEEINHDKKKAVIGHKHRQLTTQNTFKQSQGSRFEGNQLKISAPKRISLNHMDTAAAVELNTTGPVTITQGRNQSTSIVQQSKSNPWQYKVKEAGQERLYYTDAFNPKSITINHASEIRIETQHQPPLWSQHLVTDCSEIIYQPLAERYVTCLREKEGPGVATAAVAALVVAIATQGTCAEVSASLLGTSTQAISAGMLSSQMVLAHTAISAGFSSLVAQTTAALVTNEGNLNQTLRMLARGETVKSLAIAMLSAGILQEVCVKLDLPVPAEAQTFSEHLHYHIASTGIDTALNMTIAHQKPRDALPAAALNVVAGTAVSANTQGASLPQRMALQSLISGITGELLGPGALAGGIQGMIRAVGPSLVNRSNHQDSASHITRLEHSKTNSEQSTPSAKTTGETHQRLKKTQTMKKPHQPNPILETELEYRSRHAADQFLSDAVIAEDKRTAYSSSGSGSGSGSARAKISMGEKAMAVIEHLVPTAEASTLEVSERPINTRKKQSNLKSKGEYQTTARLKTALDPIVNNDSENTKVKSNLYHSQRALSFKLGNERRRDGYTKAAETLTLNHTGEIVKYFSTNPLRNLSDRYSDYSLRYHSQNTMKPINIGNSSNKLRDTLDWGSMLLRSVYEELNGNVSNTTYQWRARNRNNYPVAAQYSDAMVETTTYTYAGINYGFVNFGRGINQFGFAVRERLGLEAPGTTAIYTAYINEQDRLYSLTSGAQTFAGKFGVFFANGVIFIVPGCLVGRGILSVAGAAGATAALYPTSDGLLRTRVENGIETAAITGIIGTGFALAQPVVAAAQPLFNNVKYIFRGANPRVQSNVATELNMDLMMRAQTVVRQLELPSLNSVRQPITSFDTSTLVTNTVTVRINNVTKGVMNTGSQLLSANSPVNSVIKASKIKSMSETHLFHAGNGHLRNNFNISNATSPNQRISNAAKPTLSYNLQQKLTSKSLNYLAKPVEQNLINKLRRKGWKIDIAKPGTDDWKWLTKNGADASFNTGVQKHILLKEGAPKSALLEEFLHGTQKNLGLLEKYGTHQALEVHVKDFMLRHVKLLGLDNPHDIRLLQQLKIEEMNRLRRYE